MKLVVQRVKETRLEVDGQVISAIEKGLAIYVGVAVGDGEKDADRLAEKGFIAAGMRRIMCALCKSG